MKIYKSKRVHEKLLVTPNEVQEKKRRCKFELDRLVDRCL